MGTMTEDKLLEVLGTLFRGDEPRSRWELQQRLDKAIAEFDLSDNDCEIVARKLDELMHRMDIQ
jgi:hypothetical protein